ncbi:MAG: glycosyltransferase family 2 protein [Taibaiella sp.]|nr:glycosyltransferase family 2 protein [Taibaiella sp.]
MRISVVVITFNEEKNLARCLGSVAGLADEIVVVDSFSADNTQAIAVSFGARVISHLFEGYARQKNYATALASHDWILSLDADEVLTDTLKNSILAVKNNPAHNVYRIPRLTNYCGRWIKHCGWYPDYQTRLYNRTCGIWQDLKVHEYWKPNDENDVKGTLKGDLLHYSFDSIGTHKKKIEKYTELAALAAIEKGKSAGILKVIFSPVWHFISEYFFRLGFLDGYYGFVICRLSAYSAYLKYSRIRNYSRK